jgi:hypothetical protein
MSILWDVIHGRACLLFALSRSCSSCCLFVRCDGPDSCFVEGYTALSQQGRGNESCRPRCGILLYRPVHLLHPSESLFPSPFSLYASFCITLYPNNKKAIPGQSSPPYQSVLKTQTPKSSSPLCWTTSKRRKQPCLPWRLSRTISLERHTWRTLQGIFLERPMMKNVLGRLRGILLRSSMLQVSLWRFYDVLGI